MDKKVLSCAHGAPGNPEWRFTMNNEKYGNFRNFRLKCFLYCQSLVAIMIAIAMVNDITLAKKPQSISVVYQVTYSDRRIVNLSTPPATEKGILLVTKITSTNSALPGYETISTGNTPIEELNPQRTVEQQMRWDGSAWVIGNRRSPGVPIVRWRPPLGKTAVRVQNVLHWVTESGNQIKIAQTRLKAAKTQDAITLALRDLQRAREAQQQATLAVGELQADLLHGGISTGSFSPPRGHVLPGNAVDRLSPSPTSPNGYPPNQPILRSYVNMGGYFGGVGTGEGGIPTNGAGRWVMLVFTRKFPIPITTPARES